MTNVILTQLIDQSFRSSDFRRVANQIHYILTRYGIPTFFSPLEKFRISETFPEKMGTYYDAEFRNEPNTDWSLADNRRWAEAIRNKWKKGPEDSPMEIPLVVAGEEIFNQSTI